MQLPIMMPSQALERREVVSVDGQLRSSQREALCQELQTKQNSVVNYTHENNRTMGAQECKHK